MKFLKDKHFYKLFAVLTCSIALQNLLTYSVNLADNLMLGGYSQNALSAASLCNQFQFFLQMLVFGCGEGVVILGARYWGENKPQPIVQIIGVALRYCAVISGVLFFAALFFPNQLMGLMTNDAVIQAEAVQYLRIICFTYVLFAVNNTLVTALRSIGVVKLGYMISASTLCINIVLNSLLIYGNFGFPELGIQGAAIATLVSRTVELLIVLWYLKYREKALCITLKKLVFCDMSYHADYRRVSVPMIVTQAMWGLSSILQTLIIGNLPNSSDVIPANAATVQAYQIITCVAYGGASASAVLIGRMLGEAKLQGGDNSRVLAAANTLQVLYVIIGVITASCLYFSTELVIGMFSTLTPQAVEYTRQFMHVLAFVTLFTGYQMASDVGILRAGGDTRFAMFNNLFFVWVISLPAAALSAFVFGFSPVVVFFCIKMEQILKAPVIFFRVRQHKWMKNITRNT